MPGFDWNRDGKYDARDGYIDMEIMSSGWKNEDSDDDDFDDDDFDDNDDFDDDDFNDDDDFEDDDLNEDTVFEREDEICRAAAFTASCGNAASEGQTQVSPAGQDSAQTSTVRASNKAQKTKDSQKSGGVEPWKSLLTIVLCIAAIAIVASGVIENGWINVAVIFGSVIGSFFILVS